MEKAYKIALAQIRAWKVGTQNMCQKAQYGAKNEQKCQKNTQENADTA